LVSVELGLVTNVSEYADGQIVWTVVDDVQGETEYESLSHSRKPSTGSMEASPIQSTTPALKLRHRDRGSLPFRPETFVSRSRPSWS
jgi:hypothetical protein